MFISITLFLNMLLYGCVFLCLHHPRHNGLQFVHSWRHLARPCQCKFLTFNILTIQQIFTSVNRFTNDIVFISFTHLEIQQLFLALCSQVGRFQHLLVQVLDLQLDIHLWILNVVACTLFFVHFLDKYASGLNPSIGQTNIP